MTKKRGLSRSWAHILFGLCLFVIAPAASRAQVHGTYEESVQQAVLEYNAGNFEEAQALFRRAHAFGPNARTWRGLGICAFELRLYVEATADLEEALADPRKPLTTAQEAETRRLLEKARGFISSYRLRTVPKDARVEVDGRPALMHGETLDLNPGGHVIVVSAPGYVEQRAELRTGAGVREELRITLAVASAPPGAQHLMSSSTPSRIVDTSSQKQPPKSRRVWTWSIGIGAVAASVVAVGLRLRVNGLDDEFTDCSNHDGDCSAVKHKGERAVLGSRISGAFAGGLALGAVVAFLVEREHREARKNTAVLIGPQSFAIRCAF
jgi:hypothetical protein